jgi:hypothetical protein
MKNNDDNSVFITLPKKQFQQILDENKWLTEDKLTELIKVNGQPSEATMKAFKKTVHEENRSAKAAFEKEKRTALKNWYGPALRPYYFFKEHLVEDYNVARFLTDKVVVSLIVSVAAGIGFQMWDDASKHTELGEIKATSPATTINSGTYSPEIGKGAYVYVGNAISNGLADEGAHGYGYSNPGGAKFNYFTLAEDGNEMHLSLVEPVVAEAYKDTSPYKSQPDAKMDNYALLLKKIDIPECAWSASPVYTDYAGIMSDLKAGKDINIAWQWNGTGSDFARMAVYTALFNSYSEQVNLVPTSDNTDMLNKLENGEVDLAVFTESAGTFEGKVTGALRKTIALNNVNLVNFVPDVIPTKEGEERASLSYRFKTLSVPTSLTWTDAPAQPQSIGTMCTEYIGLYGRNPASIDSVSVAMAAERTQDLARKIDVAKATGFKAFPAIKQ